MHSSIGQNIKSHAVSGLRYPVSGVCSPARVWKTSNGHNSATRHPIDFVFGSRFGFLARIALFNLTAHELHELYYDRPTSERDIGQTLCSFERVSCYLCGLIPKENLLGFLQWVFLHTGCSSCCQSPKKSAKAPKGLLDHFMSFWARRNEE